MLVSAQKPRLYTILVDLEWLPLPFWRAQIPKRMHSICEDLPTSLFFSNIFLITSLVVLCSEFFQLKVPCSTFPLYWTIVQDLGFKLPFLHHCHTFLEKHLEIFYPTCQRLVLSLSSFQNFLHLLDSCNLFRRCLHISHKSTKRQCSRVQWEWL